MNQMYLSKAPKIFTSLFYNKYDRNLKERSTSTDYFMYFKSFTKHYKGIY